MDLNEYVPSDFSGAVSVRKRGKVVCQQAYGYADIDNERPNRLDTKFQTASASKTFTAVGILQLVEQSYLTIDSSIGQLLDIDLHQIDPDLTVRQLLTHTSGMPDYFDESVMKDYGELWKNIPNYSIRHSSDLLPQFVDKPMMFEAGDRFHYNNAGYVVLGLIIEKVTGLPFDEYLQQSVFQTAGMDGSGYFELDRLPANCATAYISGKDNPAERRTNIYSVDVKGSGAGGAYTTVLDVDRFWDALLHHKLLKPYMTAQMLGLQAKGDGVRYGYGIWLEEIKRRRYSAYMEGQDPGVSFLSHYHPESEILITVMSNTGDDVRAVHRNLLADVNAW